MSELDISEIIVEAGTVEFLDWREMFWKYSQVVGRAEGVDFLHKWDWSTEEWGAIVELMRENGLRFDV